MRILITGGAGFIGSHIQDKLLLLGHEVAVLDNFRSGKRENLNPKAKLFETSILNKEKLLSNFQEFKPEVVYHLAAQNEVPFSMEYRKEDAELNILGTMNLLEICCTNGTKKIVYSNTGGALYGEVRQGDLPIKEDLPILKPTSFYGTSKGAAEMYLRLYGNLYGVGWISLRYANVYGPRQDGNKEAGIVAIFTKKMLAKETPTINGDGLNSRDYVYIDDVVEANIQALDFPNNDYFNISTGVLTTNKQVFEAIESVLKTGIKPSYGPPRIGDATNVSLSPKKASKVLGWSPQVSFSEGVKKTIEYYSKK